MDCDNIFQKVADVSTLGSSFERRIWKAGEDFECSGSVLFHLDLAKYVQMQALLGRSAYDFMFPTHCCDENTKWDDQATRLPLLQGIHRSMQQRCMSSPEGSIVLKWLRCRRSEFFCVIFTGSQLQNCKHVKKYCSCWLSWSYCDKELFR